jgi:hypothetical protein
MSSKLKSIWDKFFISNGYDPDKDFYLDRARTLASKSKGLERFAYEIFGSSLIGSVAYALDPRKHFHIRTHLVSPVTRKRYVRGILPAKRNGYRFQTNHTHNVTIGKGPLYAPLSGSADYYFTADSRPNISIDKQVGIQGFINDTTYRTRKPNQTQGEFELYVPSFTCNPVAISRTQNINDTIQNIPDLFNESKYSEEVRYGFVGPSIIIPKAGHTTFLSGYQQLANSLMVDALPGLLARCQPTSRSFNLGYNVAELRDLPGLLQQTTRFYRDVLSKAGLSSFLDVRKLSDLYLSYKFGWESTLDAVFKMISLPAKINRDVNRLISNVGRPLSFHAHTNGLGPIGVSPTFQTELFNVFDETNVRASVSSTHNYDIRLTLNVNVRLPKVDIPSFERASLTIRKFGGDLNPVDVYNLIPWTWLGDWFSGLGDYLKILEAVSYDPQLANYALISFKGKGKCRYTRMSEHVSHDHTTYTPPLNNTKSTDRKTTYSRTGEFSFKYETRKDASQLTDDIKLTSGKGLSSYQTGVLSALIGKYSRKG